jgi:hypothetical protein
LIAVVLLVGCKKKESTPKAEDKPASTEPAMADKPVDKPADKPADPPAGDKPAAAPAAGAVDQSDPVKVLEAVFAAAAAGKADGLAALCDPAGSGDGDVKSICASKPGDPKWAEFVSYFAKGKVKGAPKLEGDKDAAAIDFTFGPDGTKNETMKLKKIDGKWYLASF